MRQNDVFPAKDYIESVRAKEGERLRARLLALAQRLADDGKLAQEHGHWLKEPYSEIYEFKPLAFRFMAFQVEDHIFVTNGAKKASKKRQNADYDIAVAMRDDFLARLSASGGLLNRRADDRER
jgi:hypothetical protein